MFVLPAGEWALPNGPCAAPLNRDAVEVHEIDARPQATARRGGMSLGNWQHDFATLVEARCAAVNALCGVH